MKLFIDNLPFDLYARSMQEKADQTPCEWLLISSVEQSHNIHSLSIEQINIVEKLLVEVLQRLKKLKSQKIADTHLEIARSSLVDTLTLVVKGAANE